MKRNSFDASNNDLGKSIRQVRRLRGISQKELAKLSGVTQGFISYVEKGTKNPTLENLEQIANALNVPSYLLLYKARRQSKRDLLLNHPKYAEFFSILYDNFDMVTNLYLTVSEGRPDPSEKERNSHKEHIEELRQELINLQDEVQSINDSIKSSLVGDNRELLVLS